MADSFEHILVTIKSTPRIFVTCSLLSGCRSCLFPPSASFMCFDFALIINLVEEFYVS